MELGPTIFLHCIFVAYESTMLDFGLRVGFKPKVVESQLGYNSLE